MESETEQLFAGIESAHCMLQAGRVADAIKVLAGLAKPVFKHSCNTMMVANNIALAVRLLNAGDLERGGELLEKMSIAVRVLRVLKDQFGRGKKPDETANEPGVMAFAA